MSELFPYVYFGLSAWFFVIWIILWYAAPHLRKEMLFLSISGFFMAPCVEIIFFRDWYNPISLWGNDFIKLESFLFGFFSAGVSGVILQSIEGQLQQTRTTTYRPLLSHEIAGFCSSLGIFYGLWMLGVHSFYAALASCGFMMACFIWRRPDLIGVMLRTACVAPLVALPGYWLMLAINPHFFETQWFLHNLSGFWILGLPIEEFLWFSYSAAMFSAAWKVHNGVTLTTPHSYARVYSPAFIKAR